MGWFQTFFRSANKPKLRHSTTGRIECLKPESGVILTSKTPSSDRLATVHIDPLVDALRAATFSDPTEMQVKLSSDEALPFLKKQLGEAATNLDDVRLHRVRAGNFPCVIFELPSPQGAGQTHFVGLLVVVLARKTADSLLPTQIRYFTLEKRNEDREDIATVLCEWTAKGERRCFGSGPAPRLDRFLFALSGMAR